MLKQWFRERRLPRHSQGQKTSCSSNTTIVLVVGGSSAKRDDPLPAGQRFLSVTMNGDSVLVVTLINTAVFTFTTLG